MDKNDVKSFVIGAISGALGAFIAVNAGLAPIPESAVEAALANVQFSLPVTTGTTTEISLAAINFNTKSESGFQPAPIGPLTRTSSSYNFDSTLMGPEYGTNREINQNIIMGWHTADVFYYTDRIAIGNYSGNISQSQSSIAIGFSAGGNNQREKAIAIGNKAGNSSQKENAIAIGEGAGNSSQSKYCVAIGLLAGEKNQGEGAVAIGLNAGISNQVSKSICLGFGSNIQTAHETTSKNKIAMCVTARSSEDNNGGAPGTGSFILTNTDAGITAAIFDAGDEEANTADILADKYFKDTNAVGFLNIKVNRGARQFVGFIPMLNLKEV